MCPMRELSLHKQCGLIKEKVQESERSRDWLERQLWNRVLDDADLNAPLLLQLYEADAVLQAVS